MIWTFLKVAAFLVMIAAAALLVSYFSSHGGGIRLEVGSVEFFLGPVQSVIAIILAIVLLWLLIWAIRLLLALIRFINGDETAISRHFDRNRDQKGYKALENAVVALASGDGKEAMVQAGRAERLLRQSQITNVLSAQAAEMSGDRRAADELYRKLLADEQTRFAGLRGLLTQKLAEGDTETALKLAQKAFEMRPSNRDIQETLFSLQTAQGDWAGARKVLGAEYKKGHLPKDVHKRRDALLALQEARSVLSDDLPIEAREAAIAANKQSPDLIPAAVLAANSLNADGKMRQAVRIISKAWQVSPHPDLAAAYAGLVPDETPAERLLRFRPLLQIRPDDEETRLLNAELLIAAEDFPAARRALGDLPERHPTTRSLTLMAAIERGEGGDDSVVRGWLTRALSASRGPQWVCDKCQRVNANWSAVCEHCGGFDTLSWREPPGETTSSSPTDLLPLVVGAPGPVVADEPPTPEPAPARAEKGAVYDAEFIDRPPPDKSEK